ncbi:MULTISPECIES: extracellular solute-binding protein [unclassified Acidisoma]|jgi:multiple sugar transport system substrate-binding protein|uniref:extracellular solute-binding protein n=1 Tax=unclassified Acidisoma TaxID=2634065 RepID=UPI00131E9E47|nr:MULTISPECIES: extracellular solute-binding protein [unclassified Acidisoma]
MSRTAWLACTCLVGLAVAGAQHARANTVLHGLFMAQAGYSEADVRKMTDAYTKLHPDVTVDLEFVPYESLHDKIVLSKGSSHGYDVVLFDVIWPAEFAKKHILMDVTSRVSPAINDGLEPGSWTTVTYQDKRYGLPWLVDSKFLFYNKAIMAKAGITEVPTTWPDVIKDAKIIKDKGILQYPLVWSWSQAEAMICDYTVLMSAYNGSFLTADGAPAFQTGGGLDALNFMVATMKDGTTNPHSTEYLEEDVRRVFSAGQAAFALNWSYMWSLAQYNAKESKVTGQVGVEVSPGVPGRSKISSVNGAMGLGIPTSSTNADAAWDYITYLTSQPVEDAYTADAIPSWKASFQDPKLMDGDEGPMARAMEQAEGQLFPRPFVPNYQQFSAALQQNIQQALLGKVTPKAALQAAADSINGD